MSSATAGVENTCPTDRPSQPHRTRGTGETGLCFASMSRACTAATTDGHHPQTNVADPADAHSHVEGFPAARTDDAEDLSDAFRPPTIAAGGHSASMSAAIELWECPRAFHLKRMIIGIGGRHVHHIQDCTGTKVWYNTSPLQLELRANSEDGLLQAMVMVQDLLETVRSVFDRWTGERAMQPAWHRCHALEQHAC